MLPVMWRDINKTVRKGRVNVTGDFKPDVCPLSCRQSRLKIDVSKHEVHRQCGFSHQDVALAVRRVLHNKLSQGPLARGGH